MRILPEKLIDAGCEKKYDKGIELYILKKIISIRLVLIVKQ